MIGATQDSDQRNAKMMLFENRSRVYIWYMSTGSAEERHLQPALI